MNHSFINGMSVDVEDYFQVEAFKRTIDVRHWGAMPLRVHVGTERLLALFNKHQIKATFFILGWIADKSPKLINRIAQEGHEIACHSYWHQRVDTMNAQQFREDTYRAKSIIEDIVGKKITGYRAPTYSFSEKTSFAYPILEELGFAYSSSVYPVKHDLYGCPHIPRFPFTASPGGLIEIPISTLRRFGRNWPIGGGGFFRLYPYLLTRWLIKTMHDCDKRPMNFYLHPWELDEEQPRQQGLSFKSRFRHYLNISKTTSRMEQLVSDFKWSTLEDVFIQPIREQTDPQSKRRAA